MFSYWLGEGFGGGGGRKMGGVVFFIFGWSITKMIKIIECIIKLQLHWKYIITIMSLYNFHTLIDVSQFILVFNITAIYLEWKLSCDSCKLSCAVTWIIIDLVYIPVFFFPQFSSTGPTPAPRSTLGGAIPDDKMLQRIAVKVYTKDWVRLANKLDFEFEDIEEFKSQNNDKRSQVRINCCTV